MGPLKKVGTQINSNHTPQHTSKHTGLFQGVVFGAGCSLGRGVLSGGGGGVLFKDRHVRPNVPGMKRANGRWCL